MSKIVYTSFEEILKDPHGAKIDQDPVSQAMVASHILENATGENFDKITDYIVRPEFSDALEVFIMMALGRRDPNTYINSDTFVKWAKITKSMPLDKF